MTVSIIIPVYNEAERLDLFLSEIDRYDFKMPTQLIIIDDKSSDNSWLIINQKKFQKNVIRYQNEVNQGKGYCIIKALNYIDRGYVAIQDADFEYSLDDLKRIIHLAIANPGLFFYGSRFLDSSLSRFQKAYYWGNRVITGFFNIVYGADLTDIETCYKVGSAADFRRLDLSEKRFEIEIEITAKLVRNQKNIKEIPINYSARSKKEGKKISYRDGLYAIIAIFKYRFRR